MTTPDQEITGYGGQPSTGSSASAPATSTTATPASGTPSMTTAPGSHALPADTRQGTGSGSVDVAQDMRDKARQVGEEAKSQGKAQLDQYRGTAADELERVANSVRAAAAELDGDRLGLSQYVANAAQGMLRLADDLRGKSVDELFRDVNRLARDNPTLFIAGSVALGFGLTRFMRASSQRSATSDYSRTGFGSGLTDSMAGDRDELPSQSELNRSLATGEPGTVGSVSNAGNSPTDKRFRTNTTVRDSKGSNGGLL